ncbi:MAG: DUF4301 family protein, partial [Tannerella sp.]|nr:DUF4301 family protein [Tannerella sp.]
MLTRKDLLQLNTKNLTESQIDEQLSYFIKGFPYTHIKASASVEKGIWRFNKEEQDYFIRMWDEYLKEKKHITKFVPASGAASRMFKDLFSFLSASYNAPTTDF